MKFKILLPILFFSLQLFAQSEITAINSDTTWKYFFKAGLNTSQTSFSGNWTGGGVGSIAIGSFLTVKALYEKNKINWRNDLQMQYGIINQDNQDETRKTVDRFLFDSKLGYDLSKQWDTYLSLSFLTQFAPGYSYNDDNSRNKISDFLAPAFLTTSWGFEYTPADFFWLRIGPFSPRITFVQDKNLYLFVPENYGVAIGETVRYEWLAFQAVAELDKDLGENLSINSRYTLFANYETLTPKKIDHFWETIITSQVTRFIDVSLGLNLIYDFDQDDQVQLSQLLAIGLLYKVGTLKEKE
jgi:hypothetical protein